MSLTIDAIYTGGVFRPVQPVSGLTENAHVTVTVPSTTAANPSPFADWVGQVTDQDSADMLSAIRDGFDRVDPADWK